MISSGMKDAGYVYVNIDDTWEGGRDAAGRILTNKKFPDMKALADYVHGKGLKLGIYSSPGPFTCAGYEGSYGHESDLTNRDVIAIDQDRLGRQGGRVRQDGDVEVWARPLAGGGQAVGLFNRGSATAQIVVRCEELQACGDIRVRNLWTHSDVEAAGPTLSASVPSHGVALFRLTPRKAS